MNYIKIYLLKNFKINVIKTKLPGIMTFLEIVKIHKKPNSWDEVLSFHNLCHLCVIERHGMNGEVAHGFIKNFNFEFFKIFFKRGILYACPLTVCENIIKF